MRQHHDMCTYVCVYYIYIYVYSCCIMIHLHIHTYMHLQRCAVLYSKTSTHSAHTVTPLWACPLGTMQAVVDRFTTNAICRPGRRVSSAWTSRGPRTHPLVALGVSQNKRPPQQWVVYSWFPWPSKLRNPHLDKRKHPHQPHVVSHESFRD